MKKQIKIALLSLWGCIALPVGYLYELADDKIIPMWGWLQVTLGAIVVVSLWGWLLPALGLAMLIGDLDRLYEIEISVYPRHTLGWVLPVILWFIIFNLIALAVGKRRTERGSDEL